MLSKSCKEKNDFSPPGFKSWAVESMDSTRVVPDLGIPRTKIKFTSMDTKSPAIVNVAGNITLLNIMSKEVTVFMIENKEVADSFRAQFESLWNSN